MYILNLNVKKEVMRKDLLRLGEYIKILQYDDFIIAMKRKIRKDILKHLDDDDFEGRLNYMFSAKIPALTAFSNNKEIKYITANYFRELLYSGSFDVFLEDSNEVFTKEINERAYIYKFLDMFDKFDDPSNFMSKFISSYYPNYFKDNVSEAKARYLASNSKIELSEEEKETIRTSIVEEMKELTVDNLLRDYDRLSRVVTSIDIKEDVKTIFRDTIFNKDFVWNKVFSFPEIDIDFINKEKSYVISFNSKTYVVEENPLLRMYSQQ